LLPETDPPARQTLLGCGGFAEAFTLGAARLGFGSRVDPFPEGTPGRRDELCALPVARLSLAESAASPDPLAAYLQSRQTTRLPFRQEALDEAMFLTVGVEASYRRARATLVPAAQLPEYKQPLDRAMTIETLNVPTNEETRRWFRFDNEAARTRRDGLTFESNGITGLDAMFARLFTSDTKESWNSPGTTNKALARLREGISSAPSIALIATDTNTVLDVFEAGRDGLRFWLALTRHGYFARPVTQAIQEYDAMRETRERFEVLSGIAPPAKVQMVLCVGKTDVPFLS
jgi:hypothetical protein